MSPKKKYKEYKNSGINNIPRRSRHRFVKQLLNGNSSNEIFTCTLNHVRTDRSLHRSEAEQDVHRQEENIEDAPDTSSENDYEEAPDHLSSDEKTLLICAYVLKHGLTKQATDDLLNLLQLFCPLDSELPSTNYILKKQLNPDKSHCSTNYYCSNCKASASLDDIFCNKCKLNISIENLKATDSYFFSFDVRPMISNLLKCSKISANLHTNLLQRNCKDTDTIEDISDGACYRALNLRNYDFSCSFNTDGVAPFRSSNSSIWPLLISVNELSYGIRRSNTMLIGLWFGAEKPNFETFLKPFIQMFNELSIDPIQWFIDGQAFSSRVLFPIFVADSVARCVVQGMTQFNGEYGCPWCLNKGETFWMDEERRSHKWVYKYHECILRTQENYLQQLDYLGKSLLLPEFKKCSYHGIKSASELLLISQFDIVNGCVYDAMHSAYLGVAKMITSYWLDSCFHDKPFYIGKRLKRIEAKLRRCRVPYDYDRTIRLINHRKFWKASEWRTWIFVASTVLQGILPEVYRLHLLKLSNSLMLLSDERITNEELQYCEKTLASFVKQTEEIYGVQACNFNIHILLHAAQCVRNWGPLWSYSAFQYENYNGFLGNVFRGSKKVITQMKSRTLELMEVQQRGRNEFHNETARMFFNSMLYGKKFAKQCKKVSNDIVFLGPFQKYAFSLEDQRKLKLLDISSSSGSSFKRCILHGKVYSREDQITQKRNNSIVATLDGKIWIIRKLVYVNCTGGKGVAVVSRIHGQPSAVNSYLTVVTQVDDAWSFVDLSSVARQKFITLDSEENKLRHLIRIPNVVEME